jgi:hypothetical protein
VNVLERFRRRPEPDPEPDVSSWPSPSAAQEQIERLQKQVIQQRFAAWHLYMRAMEDVCRTAEVAIVEVDARRDIALSPECIHELPTEVFDGIGATEMEMRALQAAIRVAGEARQALKGTGP